ncbi:MAG: flagellar assembly peptidoglycan hydrolase FlgJ [Comamonadaceae bacterium]|jgi:peptidoglycan hydrolase FlgJ
MSQLPSLNANLALDGRSLDTLRAQARHNPDQALKAVSVQFEAVFLQALLKSMRDATPQEGLMDSDSTRMYTSMLDQQMAQSLSARGIGLADVMLRQLRRTQQADPGSTPAALTPTAPVALPASDVSAAVSSPVREQSLPMASELPPVPADAMASAANGNPGPDFLSRMKTYALQAANATGIPAHFLLGQAALESGWGKREIRAADGSPSYNVFGIKAGANWKGATVDVMTTEYTAGVPRKTVQKFRAYASYAEAFQNYASLMQGNPRYAAVLKQSDGAGFAQGLQRAGYATDPRYAEKLTQVLNGPRLRQVLVA